jgi:DNA-binding response OmpR family regulator
MDGLEICRRVREIGKPAHVILLTARASKENLVQGLESGADDYLVKPLDKNELLARIPCGVSDSQFADRIGRANQNIGEKFARAGAASQQTVHASLGATMSLAAEFARASVLSTSQIA